MSYCLPPQPPFPHPLSPLTPQHVLYGSPGNEVVITLVPLVPMLPHVGRIVTSVQGPYVVHHCEEGVPEGRGELGVLVEGGWVLGRVLC